MRKRKRNRNDCEGSARKKRWLLVNVEDAALMPTFSMHDVPTLIALMVTEFVSSHSRLGHED